MAEFTPEERECAQFIAAKFAKNAAGEALNPSSIGWRWADDHPVAIVDEETVISMGDFVSVMMEISWSLMLDLSRASGEDLDNLIQNLALAIAQKA